MLNLSGYQILTHLYESSNSIVYRGIREADNQAVIVKLLKQDYPTLAEVSRYQHEYEILRNLNLDSVIKAYGLEIYQNTLAIILEDFGGSSLRSLMDERPFSLSEFLQIAIQIADSLGNIHEANIIHKDVNPSNIVFNPDTRQLKLIDFGLAARLTRSNSILTKAPVNHFNILEGTLAYMSPEQTGRMNRSLDYRTDFYSLGVTFYEWLTSKLPFETKDAIELVHCHLAKHPLPPSQVQPGIPQAVSDIVIKLLAKNAEERYQSAWGIKADLVVCLMQLEANGFIEHISPGEHDISDKFQISQKLYGRAQEIETLRAAFVRVACAQRKRVTTGDRGNSGFPVGIRGQGEEENCQSPVTSAQSKIPPPHPPRSSGGQGGVEMMLVTGYSGIGKSTLVKEIDKSVTEKHGYFITGKFEQFKGNIPYSAVISAFAGLVQQLLMENEAQLQQWREKLLSALGANAQVIIDVIPELELIVGQQPPVPELGVTESQNRFNGVFQKFIQVFCSDEHLLTKTPLVIFLDDLQWADSASLQLIELIMTGTLGGTSTPITPHYLFLIGTYRDNEVNPTHPLMRTLETLHQAGVVINQITLASLELEQITQLIADTLHCDMSRVKPLAELVLQKTGGNPFFVKEFLKTLYTENLITFDFECLRWQWNIAQIEAMHITANVVELMIGKLKKLPKSTQQVLRLSACLGNSFELYTLSTLCNKSPQAIFSALKPALELGVILPTSELNEQGLIINYQFIGNRLRQATYDLINEDRKASVHLQIGRLLLKNTKPKVLANEIFKIVDHLNLGIGVGTGARPLLTSQRERFQIAKLNLIAGKKAKTTTGFGAAIAYLSTGIKLLTAEAWQNQYELTLNLYTEAVEAAYLNGEMEQMELWAELVLKNAKTLLDKVKVYEVRIQAYTAQGRTLEAIAISLEVAKQLGVNFPQNPSPLDLQRGLEETASNLRGKSIADLINLPLMTSPEALAVRRIIASVVPATFQSAPTLFPLMILSQVNSSIHYGNSPWSAFFYANYGILLNGIVEDVESAYQFGQLAIQLVSQFNIKDIKIRVLYLVGAFILPLKHHIRESLPFFLEGYESALEIGDLDFVDSCAEEKSQYSYMMGQELTGLEREMAAYSHVLTQLKQDTHWHRNKILHQVVLNLIDAAKNPCCLLGEAYNEENFLPLLLEDNDRKSLHQFYLHKVILCYLFGDFHQALENAAQVKKYWTAGIELITIPVFYFYESLSILSLYPNVNNSEKEILLNQVAQNQEKLQTWAEHAPMNHLHKFYLVEAERHRILGEKVEAMEDYDKAIALAKENDYLNEEALANELAANFYRRWGKEKIAKAYMSEAHYCYTQWGAKAKVEDLKKSYPQLLTRLTTATHLTDTNTKTSITSTSNNSASVLDLAAVMKASQAISSEIFLNTLLTKMMKIIIENAGAEKGFFLREKSGQWVVEVSGESVLDGVTVRVAMPLCSQESASEKDLCVALPNTLINYVVRTKETMVLGDVVQDGAFTQDSYVLTHQPKSVLCTPLQSQGKLIGILYLENNLTTDAFTPERLTVLKLLCSQAAIALENARLYETLENYSRLLEAKVEERTQALQQEISDRKLLAKKLQTSESQMRAVFGAMTDIVLVIDSQRNIEVVPTNTSSLYASNPDIISYTIGQFFQDKTAETWWRQIRRALETQQTLNFDYNLPLGDQEFWFTARISPMSNHSVIWVARDISDRFFAEEALRHSEEKFAKAFRSSPCAITLTKLSDGRHIEANDSFCEFTGYTREEIMGRTAIDLNLWVNRESRDQMLQILAEQGKIHNYEFDFRTKSGEVRTALLSVEVINFYGHACLISVSQDISDRKLAEAALQKAKEEAEAAKQAADRANRAKSEFLANMSHELRTPLNAILGFSQLLHRSTNLNPQEQENLGIIMRSGEHLLTLINQVLDLSKIEASRLTLNEYNFDLYRLLDDLEDMFGLRASDKQIQLRFERSPNVPQYICTDEVKLRQVLINLLNNAIKFTQSGGVSLKVTTQQNSPHYPLPLTPYPLPLNDYPLHFEVEDTGIGIAGEELDSLFQAFVQTQSGKASQEGTGLGLAISRQFVQLLGGDITVSSTLGRGSLFKFDIKVSVVDSSVLQPKPPTRRVMALEPNQPRYRILIVDDRWENRQLLLKLLHPLGFELQQASNGLEALQVWESWQPHLIWMDMRMPVMDGYEATQRIKATTKGQATAVIALTASTLEEERAVIVSAGCDDFVRKPFREADIFETIHKHLGVRYLYDESTDSKQQQADNPNNALSPSAMAAVPTQWLTHLKQAAIRIDMDTIDSLIHEIRSHNAALAERLATLASDFKYDEILTLIQQASDIKSARYGD